MTDPASMTPQQDVSADLVHGLSGYLAQAAEAEKAAQDMVRSANRSAEFAHRYRHKAATLSTMMHALGIEHEPAPEPGEQAETIPVPMFGATADNPPMPVGGEPA